MPPSIVTELGGVYAELAARRSWSDILRVDFSEAEARGRLQRLVLMQCAAETWPLFIFRGNCWTVNGSGIVHGIDNSGEADSDGQLPEDYFVRNPNIRFFIHGTTIRIYMTFGRRWYWRKEASLGPSGCLRRDSLRDVTYRTPSKNWVQYEVWTEFNCLECGTMNRSGSKVCEKCGWVWP